MRSSRLDDYETFARERSTPVFQALPGFWGVLMYRRENECTVITLWASIEDADAMNRSATYKNLVRAIEDSDMLLEQELIGCFDAHQFALKAAFAERP